MAMLPPFDADGLLPPGDYSVSIEALRASELVLGFGEPLSQPLGTRHGENTSSITWPS